MQYILNNEKHSAIIVYHNTKLEGLAATKIHINRSPHMVTVKPVMMVSIINNSSLTNIYQNNVILI